MPPHRRGHPSRLTEIGEKSLQVNALPLRLLKIRVRACMTPILDANPLTPILLALASTPFRRSRPRVDSPALHGSDGFLPAIARHHIGPRHHIGRTTSAPSTPLPSRPWSLKPVHVQPNVGRRTPQRPYPDSAFFTTAESTESGELQMARQRLRIASGDEPPSIHHGSR